MNDSEALELLKKLVSINTIERNESAIVNVLKNIFKKENINYYELQFSPTRSQLIATIDSGVTGDNIAFCGHMDVVSVNEEQWKTDPFFPYEKDDNLYGRGTCDMKSGLVAMTVAAIRSKKNIKSGKLVLIYTIGEETGAIGAKKILETKALDFSLSGMVIAEPTNLVPVIGHKGCIWIKLKVVGKAAHGSIPEEGSNAINGMQNLFTKFLENSSEFLEENKRLGKSTYSLNYIKGGSSINIVPDSCESVIDFRTVSSENAQNILQLLKETILEFNTESEFETKMDIINQLDSVYTEPTNKFVQIINDTVNSDDMHFENSTVSIYTDASYFQKLNSNLPIVILGPGKTEMAHQSNEYVSISQFYFAISIYEEIIKSLQSEYSVD